MPFLEQVAPPGPGRGVRWIVRPGFRVNKSYVLFFVPPSFAFDWYRDVCTIHNSATRVVADGVA